METHKTVLLHPAADALRVRGDGVYVDGTFGRGGHSRLILSRLGGRGRLIAFDKDPEAMTAARALAAEDARLIPVHEGFAALRRVLSALGIEFIDGALFDLGLSSPQLDEALRGFGFRCDGPLDMRMDNSRGMSAAEWLNGADEEEIGRVIRDYGEERFWKSIAAAVVAARSSRPLRRTSELAAICARCVKTRERGQNPATRTFQAVRIAVNGELDEIRAVLPQVAGSLKTGGRMAVIAFHSLEDRLVKTFMKRHSSADDLPRWAAVKTSDLPEPPLKIIGKAIRPDASEIAGNPRARSARLRVAERTTGVWRE